MVAFDADTAERWAKQEEKKVIMVRPETKPDDVHGMLAAEGILTSKGGRTSHAALVARQFGKPVVVGISELELDLVAKNCGDAPSTSSQGRRRLCNICDYCSSAQDRLVHSNCNSSFTVCHRTKGLLSGGTHEVKRVN